MGKALSATQVKTFIENALEIREIPYISGPPGIGKSDIVTQTAENWGLKLVDVRLSQMLPEDLTGLPSLNEVKGKAEYNPFETFPMEGDTIPDGFHGWLIFLDELSSASEEVMSAIYSLLLGHSVGGKKVHPKALLIAAGNRASDSAIARELPDTLITRMLPVEMLVKSKDWLKWAKNFPGKNDSIIGFIEKYPAMLISTTDASKREELETYNNPRGWGKMFKVMNLHEKRVAAARAKAGPSSGVSGVITPDIAALLFSGVGTMPGKSFVDDYNEEMKLPECYEIAQSPSSTKIPTTQVARTKTCENLSTYFLSAGEQSREAILQYVNRMSGVNAEDGELFMSLIESQLGATASDKALVKDVGQRLQVTPMVSAEDKMNADLGQPKKSDIPF